VDDALIDIDVKDIVDMVRVFSAFSMNEERTLFVPQLFQEESDSLQPTQSEPNAVSFLQESAVPMSLKEVSRAVLGELAEAVKKKEATFRFSNVSDLMYHYSVGGLTHNKRFLYYLEKVADEQLTLKEQFNTHNTAKLLWGFAKFVNKGLSP